MPIAHLRAYAEMRPRIEAERLLDALDLAIAGSGRARPEDVRAFRARLEERAGRQPQGKRRMRTIADWLRTPGVRVTREDRD